MAFIRDITEQDLPVIKALIYESFGEGWNLGCLNQDESFMQAVLGMYSSIFLEPSTFGKVAELDGEVIGVVLCSAIGQAKKFGTLLQDIAPNTLALLTAGENDRVDIVEHMSVSFQTIGGLLGSLTNVYDGSLELIAVSKKAQGLKIGKALWNEAVTYFNSVGVKSIFLIADSACNFGFYDNNGFSRIGTKKAMYSYTAGQKESDIFVYEWNGGSFHD